MNSGSGSSGRRGGHSHGSISAELQPHLYYNKEMVEDPWRRLTPVTWKGVELELRDSKQSWHPESISMKKAKVSPESSKISNPQANDSPEFPNISIHRPSLAEYLAASFNDSTNEPVDDEQST